MSDVECVWGIQLDAVCAEAKRAAEPRRYFPQFGPALTSMARFSNLKTAVKKYETEGFGGRGGNGEGWKGL